ncbi:hypothetical protein [Zooshikella sp. RANM57]|uniref:hypothetical protein n=1 Tax=Zooshikella sp. RANM57 TaxID=3425863 RepID=UPI003D702077
MQWQKLSKYLFLLFFFTLNLNAEMMAVEESEEVFIVGLKEIKGKQYIVGKSCEDCGEKQFLVGKVIIHYGNNKASNVSLIDTFKGKFAALFIDSKSKEVTRVVIY